MTANERTTLADRCARCDASTGAPDAQVLLAEARAQVEEARRERDEARQSSEYLHVRWTETAARADGLEEQLADARLSAEQAVKVAEAMAAEKAALLERVGVLEAELSAVRGEAKCYANAVGLIDCAMGIYGLPVSETVRAVEAAALKLKRVGVVLSRGSWFVDRHMESAAAHVLDEIREAMRDDTAARAALEVEP